MKRTLARSPVALRAMMSWYDVRDEVASFLGERSTVLFAHAVSAESDCLVCSTYFRRLLIEAGEDPDDLQLDDRERDVVASGAQLARDANAVTDELFARISGRFTRSEHVALTAFAGLMVATNLFNNAIRVDLDGYLEGYRKGTAR